MSITSDNIKNKMNSLLGKYKEEEPFKTDNDILEKIIENIENIGISGYTAHTSVLKTYKSSEMKYDSYTKMYKYFDGETIIIEGIGTQSKIKIDLYYELFDILNTYSTKANIAERNYYVSTLSPTSSTLYTNLDYNKKNKDIKQEIYLRKKDKIKKYDEKTEENEEKIKNQLKGLWYTQIYYIIYLIIFAIIVIGSVIGIYLKEENVIIIGCIILIIMINYININIENFTVRTEESVKKDLYEKINNRIDKFVKEIEQEPEGYLMKYVDLGIRKEENKYKGHVKETNKRYYDQKGIINTNRLDNIEMKALINMILLSIIVLILYRKYENRYILVLLVIIFVIYAINVNYPIRTLSKNLYYQ
tara:strand:+ start:11713 stop:12795 length:1083 start_codon:yes stop_codon:yes gene_type:complete